MHYEKFQDGTVKCIEDEIPFEVPEGWAWARICSISTKITDGEHKTPHRCTEFCGYYLLSARNIHNNEIRLDDVDYVNREEFERIFQRCNPVRDDVLISCSGSVGRVTVVNDDNNYVMVRSAAMIRTLHMNPWFVAFSLQSNYIQNQIQKASKQTAQANLFQGAISSLLIPVPPIIEQSNIKDSVCNFNIHIDSLRKEEGNISELIAITKSKILDLAIQGKLVPQNPEDEPATVLLERIRAEKEELIKAGKIKRDKKESIIFRGEDNSYYLRTGDLIESLEDWDFGALPDSWSICCLGELCDYGNCENVDTASISDSAWILDLEDIEKDTGIVLRKVRKSERSATSTKHLFHKGQILYSKLRPYLNKVVLADEDGCCTSEILPLEFEKIILPQYARYYMMSPTFLKYANRCSYGIKMPRLGTEDGKKAIIPIPPVIEQKRIVLVIDQAFAELAFISQNLF